MHPPSWEIDTATLVGYEGGSLCTLASECPDENAGNFHVSGNPFENLAAGTLSSTPEPSTAVLLPTALLVLAFLAQKRFARGIPPAERTHC